MPKSVSVIWAPLAEKDFGNILQYLEQKWNETIANKFLELTINAIDRIRLNPKQFPLILVDKKIRKCVLTKQNTLFFVYVKNEI